MDFLININIAYILVAAAVMLALATILFPRSLPLKIGMVVCLGAAGFELFHFQANPWMLVIIALSPLPFYFATRLASMRRQLLVVTVVMFLIGSVFLFVDKNGRPAVNTGLLFLVSVICAEFIWVSTEARLKAQDTKRGIDPDSYIGLIGEASTDIHEVGMVQIEGEFLPARSDEPIPSGSEVRVVKYEGRVLVVKKVEKLSGK